MIIYLASVCEFLDLSEERRTGLWLRQTENCHGHLLLRHTEHIRDHLWLRYTEHIRDHLWLRYTEHIRDHLWLRHTEHIRDHLWLRHTEHIRDHLWLWHTEYICDFLWLRHPGHILWLRGAVVAVIVSVIIYDYDIRNISVIICDYDIRNISVIICDYDIRDISVIICDYQGRTQGGAPGPRPPKIGKNMIFLRKIVIFTRNTPKIIVPRSARCNFFKCAPLAWNPRSAPVMMPSFPVYELSPEITCHPIINMSIEKYGAGSTYHSKHPS
jgi:hypothetical protein